MNDTADEHHALGVPNRSSIDLSLELERQLEAEIPDSPVSSQTKHRTSLDPNVLAHIVTQLRDSLTNVNKEREDLIQQLTESHSRIAEFKDAISLLTDRCERLESDLAAARQKNQDDEEAISMLRSKVEESRRGLMRLQSERNAESKRMTLDLTHARSPSFAGPRSSTRASFAPLTGSGVVVPSSFRRTSTAVNENDPGFAEFVANLPGSPAAVTADNGDGNDRVNRRRSMLGAVNRASGSFVEGRASPSQMEIDSLKRELMSLKGELGETRHELTESNEAREASESCVTALRAFIGQLGDSGQGVQLPPLPTDSHIKDIEPAPKSQKSTGWGLKLWKVDANVAPITTTSPAIPPSRPLSPPVPLRSKFGAFFTRGSSISSLTHPAPSLHQEEPILNGSDVSSLSEKSEPPSPIPEGNAVSPLVVVRGSNNELDSHENVHAAHSSENGGHDNLKAIAL
ncbi:hypothetical protein BU17DRAFT_49061 [Hysterangium stoloniferum]|nr:hypothetical protein BU17DRAFT_49061 [Hysterangium stoloniferum]